jgi:hypothetical protein
MGILFYAGEAIPMDDRTLAHLKVAVVTKLRRGESFTLSWTHPGEAMGGRTTIWMHETIPLRFEFLEPEAPALHREWIEEILRSANTTGGIQLTPEHMETGPSEAEAPSIKAEEPSTKDQGVPVG